MCFADSCDKPCHDSVSHYAFTHSFRCMWVHSSTYSPPGFAIDLLHQIKGCWSQYWSSLPLSQARLWHRQMFSSLPRSPGFINLFWARWGEGRRKKRDLWVVLHRSQSVLLVMMSCIHQAVGTICFCLFSLAITSLKLMDDLMSFSRHQDRLIWIHRCFG